MTRATYMKLIGAMLVLTVVQSVIMLIPDWNGMQGSAEADEIDLLLDVMIVLSCFVFAIVIVMLGYCIYKYRAKPGDESDGKPIHGNTRLEIAWTVIPTGHRPLRRGLLVGDPGRHRGGGVRPDAGERDRAAVQMDLRVPGVGRGLGRVPRPRQAYSWS